MARPPFPGGQNGLYGARRSTPAPASSIDGCAPGVHDSLSRRDPPSESSSLNPPSAPTVPFVPVTDRGMGGAGGGGGLCNRTPRSEEVCTPEGLHLGVGTTHPGGDDSAALILRSLIDPPGAWVGGIHGSSLGRLCLGAGECLRTMAERGTAGVARPHRRRWPEVIRMVANVGGGVTRRGRRPAHHPTVK